MRKKKLEILVYWNNKQATLQECTHNMLNFLCKLKAYQPSFFGTWYGAGRSEKERLHNKIAFEYESIKRQFSKKDRDDSYPDICYRALFSNAKECIEYMKITVALGGISRKHFANTNDCYIKLPKGGAVYDYFEEPLHQLALIRLMIDHWNPDFICIHDYTKDILPPFTDEKLLQAISENIIYFETLTLY